MYPFLKRQRLKYLCYTISLPDSQVVDGLFAVRGTYLKFSSASMPFPLKIRSSKKKRAADGPRTDRRMDGRTDPHIEMRGRT